MRKPSSESSGSVSQLILDSYHPDDLFQSRNNNNNNNNMKDVLYEVRCLKSNEDMILALTGQFKQLSGIAEVMGSNPVESPEFFRFMRQLLKLSSKCEDHIFI